MNARVPLLVSVLLLGVLACNLSAGQGGEQDLPATITAQAAELQAANEAAAASATPELLAEPSGAQVTVSSDTNCRTGPSTDFDVVLTMHPGSTATVIGKYTQANYWIISNAAGGSCWLWGQYAQVTGDTSSLPDYPAPPPPAPQPTKEKQPTKTPAPSKTPEPQVPDAPAQPRHGNDPVRVDMPPMVSLPSGSSPSPSAGGTGPPTTTGTACTRTAAPCRTSRRPASTYQIEMRYPQGTGGALYINFGVEAFNEVGSSARVSVDVPKCP